MVGEFKWPGWIAGTEVSLEKFYWNLCIEGGSEMLVLGGSEMLVLGGSEMYCSIGCS